MAEPTPDIGDSDAAADLTLHAADGSARSRGRGRFAEGVTA